MADTAMVEDRRTLVRQAFFLEYVTLAWMTIEAGGTIISGIAAHSITLLAFGIDSLIELASAGVLIWRLTVELRHGQSFAESAERAYRRGTPVCSRGLYRGGSRMEPLDATRASLFVAGIAH